MRPLCIDLFCGLGGWTEGFLAEGYRVVGFDIEVRPYPAQLVLQDILTMHGSQFKDAAVIVASPPCQAYSYRAMPWKRAKALPPPSNELFDACFRIQREAINATGQECPDCDTGWPEGRMCRTCGGAGRLNKRHIPLVVENVRGAQPWVGRAVWNYGSFYLWGDVPALMPVNKARPKVPGFRFDGRGRSFQSASVEGTKTTAHINQRNGHGHTRHLTNPAEHEGVKNGGDWFGSGSDASAQRRHGSKSNARKLASAQIAKIPFALAQHIARVYKPDATERAA